MAGRRRLITMARRRHTPEQIIRKLREADRLLGEGAEIADVARQLEVSEQTYHRWRNQYGGMKADDAKRLKDLERENARLKRIVADKELEIDALREISRETGRPVAAPPSCPDAPGAARAVGAAGVRDRRPAPLHPASRAG
jgi:transposase-like protein